MAKVKRPDERQCFAVFWQWLTGHSPSVEDLDGMESPTDPPDFCCLHGTKRIAVEHTHVFRETAPGLAPLHSLQIQRRICNYLTDQLKETRDPLGAVHVSVTFGPCDTVNGRRQEVAVATHLCDVVLCRLAGDPELPMHLHAGDLSKIHPCLCDVLITAAASKSSASRHTFGRVDEWGLPQFQAAADAKGKDLPRYASRFDECWLLLEGGGPHRSQWIEPSDEARLRGIRTEFDRVFFIDVPDRQGYEIRAVRVGSPNPCGD